MPKYLICLLAVCLPPIVHAAELDDSNRWRIVLTDTSGAPIVKANWHLICEGQELQTGESDAEGLIQIGPLTTASCRLQVEAPGFAEVSKTIGPNPSGELSIHLTPRAVRTDIVVTASSEVIRESIAAEGHLTAVEMQQVPMTNLAIGLTEILTRTTPGVAADANGFAHPLGEHADTSLSLDGQPITDQQAKIFANQIDPNIIQSLTATTGAPSIDFGGKTSLAVEIRTKSGLGHKPAGSISSDYGSFETWSGHVDLAVGTNTWGNFFSLTGTGSNRFLDTPEFEPIHAAGNSTSAFDRIDWQPREEDALHLNLSAGRSWFQTPLSYDTAALGQDQRSQIRNLNVAIGWNHIFSPQFLLLVKPFFRRDQAEYFPSSNILADQPATLSQDRTLANAGVRTDLAWARGVHTAKAGFTYARTMLRERFSVGLTDPLYNAVCLDTQGEPIVGPGISDRAGCSSAALVNNPEYLPKLLPYDLSRGGSLFKFDQTASVKETALYAQDEVRWRSIIATAGVRLDRYRGLSSASQLTPRLGVAWRTPFSRTLLRASYARLFETPYNENLIFANAASQKGSGENPFGTFRSEPVRPGTRNQFNVGLQQKLGAHLAIDADYYWKFTRNAFDFGTLFNTPITFSVAWRKSKIDGLALRLTLLDVHGLTAYTVMGHVRSRFFTPQVGGLIFNSTPGNGVFRIDHGEEFEQTTQVRYQLPARLAGRHQPWVMGVWRYNSGLALPDTVPVYTEALRLTGDEQAQIGLRCGSQLASPDAPIRSCSQGAFSTSRIRIPAPGTQNDDLNPVRVTPRTLFDFSAGDDSILKRERFTVGARFTVVNATNRVALYNFLSTFSGTHFVAPRSYQAALRLTF